MNNPLLGFSPPPRYFPIFLPLSLLTRADLSWGFLPLQRSRRRESTSCQLPGKLPGFGRESANRSHAIGYGVAHRLSQPHSDFFFSSPSCRFQAGGVPGVVPFRGLILLRSPDSSSLPACPLDVLPAGCASPVLGGRSHRRTVPLPRMARRCHYHLQGF